MTWEERAGVSVWTDAEEDEVEDRKTSRVFLGKLVDKRFLVCVGELFEVIEERDVDGVNVVWRYGNFAEQLLLAKMVVGVVVIQRNTTFIGKENLPVR